MEGAVGTVLIPIGRGEEASLRWGTNAMRGTVGGVIVWILHLRARSVERRLRLRVLTARQLVGSSAEEQALPH